MEVIIKYPEAFEEKKKRIVNAGKDNLHVISDFDRTITYGLNPKGIRTETVISKLRSDAKYLGEDYAKKAHELFDFYHPFEIAGDIPMEEKKVKMHEWWKKHFDFLVECGFSKEVMEQVVKEKPLRFREGALDFIKTLDSNNIPLVFLSAAPGDMLVEYLKKNNLFQENVHVISNRYEFDSQGKALKILEPIIHVFNKGEASLREFSLYEDQLKDRKNIILMGDTLGDADMAEGSDSNDVIKIGFLNENVEENLEQFKEAFDVVLLGDPGMDYINELLESFN